MATQIGAVDVEFLETDSLPLQVCADLPGDIGFWHIRGGHAYRTNETGIQIVKYMTLVPIHPHTSTLASMPHLSIFDTDAPIFGHAFDQVGFAVLTRLDILRFDLLGNRQRSEEHTSELQSHSDLVCRLLLE